MDRYDPQHEYESCWMAKDELGEYVEYDDYLAEIATLRAENERMRGALVRLEKIGDKVPVDIGLIALIAKDALK